jgi:tight adherence protein B
MFDSIFLMFGVSVFVAVALGLEGLYLWWNSTRSPEARRMERRLRALSAGGHGSEQYSLLKRRALSRSPEVSRLLMTLPRIGNLDRLLVQSGLPLSVGELFGMTAALGLAGLLGALVLHGGWLVGCAAGLALAALPSVYVTRARRLRLQAIEARLPDAIDLMGRALRAGHAFPTSVQMVGEDMPGPIGDEFRILFDEINFGVPTQDALLNLVGRVPSTDLRYFVVAVMIQRETGGNLAELLDNISAIVRARIKLMGQVHALSAEGRLSAWILAVMPFVMTFLINLINPEFMRTLWVDPVGQWLVGASLGLMALGALWMRKVIRIHV